MNKEYAMKPIQFSKKQPKNYQFPGIGAAVLLFFTVQCAQIYSPFGIKGSDARAEIEETRTIGNVITLPFLQSNVSSGVSDVDNFTCSFSDAPTLGSENGSSPTSFEMPTTRKTLDLATPNDSSSSQTYFFRSVAFGDSREDLLNPIRIQSLKTSNVETRNASCYYRITNSCSGALTSDKAGFTGVLTEQPTRLEAGEGIVLANACLEIQCDGASALRIRYDNLSDGGTRSNINFDTGAFLIGPALFEALSNIDDNKYYKQKSFDECKETVLLLTLLQARQSLGTIAGFNQRQREVIACNTLVPGFSTQEANLLANIVQGAVCSLEEVNLIGL